MKLKQKKEYTWNSAKRDTRKKWRYLAKRDYNRSIDGILELALIMPDIYALEGSCGFCEYFKAECSVCALGTYDHSCHREDAIYKLWWCNPTQANAKLMLQTINKSIKQYEQV